MAELTSFSPLTQNNFGPLNDHIITEFSWVVTMAPAVPSTDTCNVTVSIVKTIVIVAYLPYQTKQNESQGFVI